MSADEELASSLPIPSPLSPSNPFLSSPQFDLEQFLLSRKHTSLPDLRSQLRDYLSELKQELVRLINDDYQDFISLSTDLKEEGARLETLRAPLGDLRKVVRGSRNGLQDIQHAIQAKLKQRAVLREEKVPSGLLRFSPLTFPIGTPPPPLKNIRINNSSRISPLNRSRPTFLTPRFQNAFSPIKLYR
jgi:conserved oligomeric Golgi complex subunit 2